MRLTVVGSINMDYIYRVNELPKLGETLTASFYESSFGGKGANQAVAAARLGAEVSMIGAVGKDMAGEELRDNLQREKIDVSGLDTVDTPSGNAMITVDHNGNNTIVVYAGSNFSLTPEWVNKHEEIIKNSDCVLVQLEIPMEVVEKTIEIANKYSIKIILNPAPAKEIPSTLYSKIDFITPNETELEKITGTADIEGGIQILLGKGVDNVVVTLGEEGSIYGNKEKIIKVKSFEVKAIDSTAAGDAFNAALAFKICEGKSIGASLSFANAVGALTTTKMGAQNSLPFRKEIDKLLEAESAK